MNIEKHVPFHNIKGARASFDTMSATLERTASFKVSQGANIESPAKTNPAIGHAHS
ncbi:hypothetical protein J3P89_15840 [Pseudomonas sp. Z1-14]|uniref:hypothetical protein n=1 Tax=Pseudomonas sp. Z1-14 TaxID=2817409 RepID=UPI003DA8AB83